MSILRRVIILGSLLFFTSLTLSFSFTSRYQTHSTTKTEYRHLAHSDLFEDSYPEEEATSVSYSSANTKISAESQHKFNLIINSTLSVNGLGVKKTEWFSDRIEVVVYKIPKDSSSEGPSEQEEFPNAELLEQAHKSLYAVLETTDASLVEDYELIVASPGLDEELRHPRDFVTFQGFPVIVSLKQEFRKKSIFEGSLQERTDEHVVISIKGRILRIPLGLVDRVELPKPKFEPYDVEIRKLR